MLVGSPASARPVGGLTGPRPHTCVGLNPVMQHSKLVQQYSCEGWGGHMCTVVSVGRRRARSRHPPVPRRRHPSRVWLCTIHVRIGPHQRTFPAGAASGTAGGQRRAPGCPWHSSRVSQCHPAGCAAGLPSSLVPLGSNHGPQCAIASSAQGFRSHRQPMYSFFIVVPECKLWQKGALQTCGHRAGSARLHPAAQATRAQLSLKAPQLGE